MYGVMTDAYILAKCQRKQQCNSRDSASVNTQQKRVHSIVAETERRQWVNSQVQCKTNNLGYNKIAYQSL